MAIAHCAVHGIRRAGLNAPVELSLADSTLAINGHSEELLRELKHAYVARGSKTYGQFSGDIAVAQVSAWLREFKQGRLGFDSFTRTFCEHFQTILAQVDAEFDGYFLFAHEELADAEFLFVFALQHSEGTYVSHDLTLQSSRYVDLSGIRLGAKINITEWEAGEGSYLSVLRARGDKNLSDAFFEAVGFSDQRDLVAETTEFLDIVTSFTATMPEEEAGTYRHKVIEFCIDQDKRGEPVVIEALSEHVNEKMPQAFSRYVAEQQKEIKPAIIPDRKQLRQFVRISGRNDQLSMSFTSDCLGGSVRYDRNTDSLTITDLPGPLKIRLLQHLQKYVGAHDAAQSEADIVSD